MVFSYIQKPCGIALPPVEEALTWLCTKGVQLMAWHDTPLPGPCLAGSHLQIHNNADGLCQNSEVENSDAGPGVGNQLRHAGKAQRKGATERHSPAAEAGMV